MFLWLFSLGVKHMQTNPIIRKGLAVGIILLFVGTCIIPSTAQNIEKPLPKSRGHWLYVGGNGSGNFTKIQDAINASSDGDTVFVFQGTYHEHLITISKGIFLRGENRLTTIIDGDNMDMPVLLIHTNANVSIETFTITNSTQEGIFEGGEYNPIKIEIYTNIITKTQTGIFLNGMEIPDREFRIGHNEITETEIGILMTQASGWIYSNKIYNNSVGIELSKSIEGGAIERNVITNNNQSGLYLKNIKNSFIAENSFTKNYYGVYLENISIGNVFYHNNFINNRIQAFIDKSLSNTWQGNYWNNWIGRLIPILPFIYFPKVIIGRHGSFLCFDFDWSPPWIPYPWN